MWWQDSFATGHIMATLVSLFFMVSFIRASSYSCILPREIWSWDCMAKRFVFLFRVWFLVSFLVVHSFRAFRFSGFGWRICGGAVAAHGGLLVAVFFYSRLLISRLNI